MIHLLPFVPFLLFVFLILFLRNKKFADKFYAGNTIKDYGLIDDVQQGISNIKHSVLLSEKEGKRKIFIKEEVYAGLGWGKRYFEFDIDSAQKLRDVLNDALKV